MVQTFSGQRRVVFGLGWIEHPPEKAQLCVYIPTMYTVPDGAPQSRQLGKTIMWETWVQSLGWEDPLEKGKATHSSILAWRIPTTV